MGNSKYDKVWTDLDPDMLMDWNKDVARITGVTAVHYSMFAIISTRKGSRPFYPDFGCSLTDMLFENWSPLTKKSIETSILNAISTYEPRVEASSIDVNSSFTDENHISVTVSFKLVELPEYEQQPLVLGLSPNGTTGQYQVRMQ